MRSIRLTFVILLTTGAASSQAAKTNYADDLQPILRNECASCHNADKKKGGLDLSNYRAILTGSDSGQVANAGDPDGSLLYKVVAYVDEPHMPKGKAKLLDKDIAVFKQWIADGLLETATGKAAIAKGGPKLNLSVASSGSGRPKGSIAMPAGLSLDPVVHTARPGAVLCLAESPWAPLAAIGGRHQILLYNTDTLQLLGVIPFAAGDPYVAKFSRNGSMLLVGGGRSSKSGQVLLYDVAQGKQVAAIGDEFDAILAADISPDQTSVALGGPGKTVKIFTTADGQMTAAIKKHTDWITALAYSPDGVLLASGDRQGGLWVWEAKSGSEFYGLQGHKAAITSVCFRDDSNILASASEDGTVKLWEMQEGKQVKSWTAHAPGVTSVSFSHDGRLVTSGRDHVARVWKSDGGALITTAAFPDIALQATFDSDGKRLIADDWSGAIKVFDVKDAKHVGDLTANPPTLAEQTAAADKQLKDARAAADASAAKLAEAKRLADAAAQELAAANARMVYLQRAKLDTAIIHAREEADRYASAAKQRQIAAADAEAASQKASKELATTRELIATGAVRLADARRGVTESEHQLEGLRVAVATSEKALTTRQAIAQQAARVAEDVSDASRQSSASGHLADSASRAKTLYDALAVELSVAEQARAGAMHELASAQSKAAQSQAATKQLEIDIQKAPGRIAELEKAMRLAQDDSQKQKTDAAEAARVADVAAKRLAQLEAEARQQPKTSTAAAR